MIWGGVRMGHAIRVCLVSFTAWAYVIGTKRTRCQTGTTRCWIPLTPVAITSIIAIEA